jgi:hypothetical protein
MRACVVSSIPPEPLKLEMAPFGRLYSLLAWQFFFASSKKNHDDWYKSAMARKVFVIGMNKTAT